MELARDLFAYGSQHNSRLDEREATLRRPSESIIRTIARTQVSSGRDAIRNEDAHIPGQVIDILKALVIYEFADQVIQLG